MKIYLGADHRGFALKEKVFAYMAKQGYEVSDVGDKELNPNDDFPEIAQMAVMKVLGDENDDARGILLCGGGQGMSMAANRFRGIRASVIWSEQGARATRNDNDSNILCMPADLLEKDEQLWKAIVDAWLKTPFAAAPRYKRRNAQIDEM